MPSYYNSQRNVIKLRAGSRGRQNTKVERRRRPAPELSRVPLDRCAAPLWRVCSLTYQQWKYGTIVPGKTIVEYGDGRPDSVKSQPEKKGGVIHQQVVTLEYFRGDKLKFTRTFRMKDGKITWQSIKDHRDEETTNSVSTIEKMVSDKIGEPWCFPVPGVQY